MSKLSIFCDISATELPESTQDLIYAQSPLSCLSLAEIHSPDFIFLRSRFGSIEKNSKLIELCSCLKNDPHTKSIPVIVLLQYPQRALSSALRQYQVEYIQFIDGDPVTPDFIARWISSLDTLPEAAEHDETICPYLNYEQFNEVDEITLCRADLNRLVINSKRLLQYCSNSNHHSCPYFQKPRLEHTHP